MEDIMYFIDEEVYKNKFGIYAIKNLCTGHVYIGQTGENFQRRYWHHQWKLRNNQHDNSYLQNSWNKYGEENFVFMVISVTENHKELDGLEIQYIDLYKKAYKSYNVLGGGGGRRGCAMSLHAKQLVGEANRRHMTGKKHTDATKAKMSRTRIGKYIARKNNVLDLSTARKIKERLIKGETPSDIAKDLGVPYKAINGIMSNNTWKCVEVDGWDEYYRNRKTYHRLTKEDHDEIYHLYIEDGYTKQQLAEMYHKTDETIRKIIKKHEENKI